jgi:hypothetical protein
MQWRSNWKAGSPDHGWQNLAAWAEAAPRLSSRKVFIDVCNVTYVDKSGEQALRNIYAQTGASFVATTPEVLYLAGEIAGNRAGRNEVEPASACNE